eukprot:6214571-Pleurochrysis_carterae.AAC.5
MPLLVPCQPGTTGKSNGVLCDTQRKTQNAGNYTKHAAADLPIFRTCTWASCNQSYAPEQDVFSISGTYFLESKLHPVAKSSGEVRDGVL